MFIRIMKDFLKMYLFLKTSATHKKYFKIQFKLKEGTLSLKHFILKILRNRSYYSLYKYIALKICSAVFHEFNKRNLIHLQQIVIVKF